MNEDVWVKPIGAGLEVFGSKGFDIPDKVGVRKIESGKIILPDKYCSDASLLTNYALKVRHGKQFGMFSLEENMFVMSPIFGNITHLTAGGSLFLGERYNLMGIYSFSKKDYVTGFEYTSVYFDSEDNIFVLEKPNSDKHRLSIQNQTLIEERMRV